MQQPWPISVYTIMTLIYFVMFVSVSFHCCRSCCSSFIPNAHKKDEPKVSTRTHTQCTIWCGNHSLFSWHILNRSRMKRKTSTYVYQGRNFRTPYNSKAMRDEFDSFVWWCLPLRTEKLLNSSHSAYCSTVDCKVLESCGPDIYHNVCVHVPVAQLNRKRRLLYQYFMQKTI